MIAIFVFITFTAFGVGTVVQSIRNAPYIEEHEEDNISNQNQRRKY